MTIYRNSSTDPYFNLAAEQYLLDTATESIFMLWRNSSAVIIGKNQNAYSELDIDYVEKNNIKVVRRLTGGGAVFHDEGNVNFTFITPNGEDCTLDFARFTAPIIEALTHLGLENVCLSGRNDLMANGVKVSGNAQTSYNGKTLHHGTLLFSADLTRLAKALTVDPEKIESKGIKSVRSRVGNIKDMLNTDMDALSFMAHLEKFIISRGNTEIKDLTERDKKYIQELADSKYSTWEWNYGKSKQYTARKKRRYPFGTVIAELAVNNGIIDGIKLSGDFFGSDDPSFIEQLLTGVRCSAHDLQHALEGQSLESCISGMKNDDLIRLLLSQEA